MHTLVSTAKNPSHICMIDIKTHGFNKETYLDKALQDGGMVCMHALRANKLHLNTHPQHILHITVIHIKREDY